MQSDSSRSQLYAEEDGVWRYRFRPSGVDRVWDIVIHGPYHIRFGAEEQTRYYWRCTCEGQPTIDTGETTGPYRSTQGEALTAAEQDILAQERRASDEG